MKNNYEVHFAPLQGYTDWIFRKAFAHHFRGIEAFYTPFIRVEKDSTFRNRDLRDLDPVNNEDIRLIPQILPGSAEEFRILIRLIKEKGYQRADINLGCPFPLITGKRKGSGMLPHPELFKEVLTTIDEFPEIEFSLKMRLGLENASECLNIVDEINGLRLCGVTVHARIGKQQYKGTPDLIGFRKFYQECKHPIFYNGDLNSVDDIQKITAEFPLLRGVFIGRGLLSSPFMAEEFQENATFSIPDRIKRFLAFHETLFSAYSDYLKNDRLLLQKMKSFWEYFLPEIDRKLVKKIKKSRTPQEYLTLVKTIN